jgi:hypothetical protein
MQWTETDKIWPESYQSERGDTLYATDTYDEGLAPTQITFDDVEEDRYEVRLREKYKPNEETVFSTDDWEEIEEYFEETL